MPDLRPRVFAEAEGPGFKEAFVASLADGLLAEHERRRAREREDELFDRETALTLATEGVDVRDERPAPDFQRVGPDPIPRTTDTDVTLDPRAGGRGGGLGVDPRNQGGGFGLAEALAERLPRTPEQPEETRQPRLGQFDPVTRAFNRPVFSAPEPEPVAPTRAPSQFEQTQRFERLPGTQGVFVDRSTIPAVRERRELERDRATRRALAEGMDPDLGTAVAGGLMTPLQALEEQRTRREDALDQMNDEAARQFLVEKLGIDVPPALGQGGYSEMLKDVLQSDRRAQQIFDRQRYIQGRVDARAAADRAAREDDSPPIRDSDVQLRADELEEALGNPGDAAQALASEGIDSDFADEVFMELRKRAERAEREADDDGLGF